MTLSKRRSTGNYVFYQLQTYYPSNAYHGPVLLASYTWAADAEKFNSLNATEGIEEVGLAFYVWDCHEDMEYWWVSLTNSYRFCKRYRMIEYCT